MRAMLLESPGKALRLIQQEPQRPGRNQVLLRVRACGICRTDLHILDGELSSPALPLILGHQIVGEVVETGTEQSDFRLGMRVGVPWLASTCNQCRYCLSGRENLCRAARFTGYTVNGGFAEYALADANYCVALPHRENDTHLAPLLCAGLIGYRALQFSEGENLGLYGFGAAAHVIAQVAQDQGRRVFAFVRPGDEVAKAFALSLGALWAGDSTEAPPEELHSAIVFAPVGALIPLALRAIAPGGTVVCGGIHMSDIPGFPYELLWNERKLVSVANLTREDARSFFALCGRLSLTTSVQTYRLEAANQALVDLREGRVSGAAVLTMC